MYKRQVLFRGAAEEVIRKHLIQKLNVLDAVIGLPANLFFGTGIPAVSYTHLDVYKRQRLVLRETAELLSLDLVRKKLVTNQIVLTMGFDVENLTDPARRQLYTGPVVKDHYGRMIPKHAHGTERLETYKMCIRDSFDIAHLAETDNGGRF